MASITRRFNSRVDRRPETEEANIYFEMDPGSRAHFDGVELAGQVNRPKESVITRHGLASRLWADPASGMAGSHRKPRPDRPGKPAEGFSKRRPAGSQGHAGQAGLSPGQQHRHALFDDRQRSHCRGSHQAEPRFPGAACANWSRFIRSARWTAACWWKDSGTWPNTSARKGYFDAQVDFMQTDPEPNRSLIEYNITSGDRHKLKHIEITGNRYFDAATLRERMYLQTASLLRRRYGLYSERLLQQDEQTIADLYRANGFPDVMVTHPPVQDDFGGEHGNLAVEIQVNEGTQWLVNQLVIEGVPAEDRRVPALDCAVHRKGNRTVRPT